MPSRSTPLRWPCGWSKRPARRARVSIGSALGKLGAIRLADLLEEKPQARKRAVDLHGYQVATVLARLEIPKAFDDATPLAPEAEAAQPLYARYWLHNRGPAPLGGLPAVAHLHPQQRDRRAGRARWRCGSPRPVTAAMRTLHGAVVVVCPDGWSATPAELPFTLGSGEHLEADVVLAIPAATAARAVPGPGAAALTGDGRPGRLAPDGRGRVRA